ncbi:MAG: 3-deoxy-D-manno-octulosonic acid transferase [Flavobacteriales bacterium]
MALLYTLTIYIYQLLLKLAAFWHPKAKLLIEGRKASWNILEKNPKTNKKRYWFHCASLGEYDMALPLIEACRAANPELEVAVSFYSPSGMQHYQKRGFVPDFVFYLPADTPAAMKKIVAAVAAERLYLLKYEFWPNVLSAAQVSGLDVFAVNTILRPTQIYFKWYGGLFRKALRRVSYFGVQNKVTQELLRSVGIASHKIEILGDLRWNRVLEAKQNAPKNQIIESFSADGPLLILGSSWPEEEKLLFEMLQREAQQSFKILIAPHDLSRGHLVQLQERFPEALLYTQVEKNPTTFNKNHHIMILDTIGQLSAAYQYGSAAFVGGGFSGSLHNILEPLAYGLPVLFGTRHQKFPEAQQFLELGFAKEIVNAQDLDSAVKNFLENAPQHQEAIEQEVFKMQVNIPDKLVN